MSDPSDYESLQQAASRWGVSSKTIRRRINSGELRGYRFGPRLIRVNPAEVDALLDSMAEPCSVASACDAWLAEPREPQEVCPCGHYRTSHGLDGCHRCTPSLDSDSVQADQ